MGGGSGWGGELNNIYIYKKKFVFFGGEGSVWGCQGRCKWRSEVFCENSKKKYRGGGGSGRGGGGGGGGGGGSGGEGWM